MAVNSAVRLSMREMRAAVIADYPHEGYTLTVRRVRVHSPGGVAWIGDDETRYTGIFLHLSEAFALYRGGEMEPELCLRPEDFTLLLIDVDAQGGLPRRWLRVLGEAE